MSARKLAAVLVCAGALTLPSRASADWLIAPFFGANFEGDADFGDVGGFDDEVEKRLDVGTSIGWMGNGIAGFEVDLGWSPNFFENTTGDGDFEFGDNNVFTLMANVLVGVPIGGQFGPGLRPYGSGGLGLIRSRAELGAPFDDLSTNDWGLNIGGGLHGFFNDVVGLRGDVRYFRSLEDHEPDHEFDIGLSDFDYWRATVGVTFRFNGF
jgi:hypothetical protein